MFSRQMVIDTPEQIPEIKAEAKATLELIKYCERLQSLRKYGEWSNFDWALMCSWANKVDEPFVTLMLSLSRHGYEYGAISMHRWWNRLKAVNQQHIIQFFTYQGFKKPDKDKKLWWLDIYNHCCRTHDIFEQMSAVFNDDKSVEMNLRTLLGISQKSDIEQAWHTFAKTNHPDKGGSVERFILVKAAYEEWKHGN